MRGGRSLHGDEGHKDVILHIVEVLDEVGVQGSGGKEGGVKKREGCVEWCHFLCPCVR